MERTIFYGQTKKFVSKKSFLNNELSIENFLTSSSLILDNHSISVYDTGKKTEKKSLSKIDMNDN